MPKRKRDVYSEYSYKDYIWKDSGRRDKVKGKKKKKREFKFDGQGAFVAISFGLCFLITFLLAEVLGGSGLLNILSNKASSNTQTIYYALAVDSYTDESLSAISADELRQLGGGGFVINDGKYYLIASAYKTADEAETVKNRMDGSSSSVYKIVVTEPKLNWCKTADKSAIIEVLGYAEKCFNSLYNLSCELDNGNISESVAISRINTLHNEIGKLTTKLNNITVSDDNVNLLRVKAELSATKAMLNNLINQSLARYNLVSDVRYTYVAVIWGYKNLTSSI